MDLVTLALAKSYIDKKINEEGIVAGATPQQAAQIEQNKADIADLQAEIGGNYVKSVNGIGPDKNGNIEIPAGVDVSDAQAGQIIIVKSVDENGKPTEWEATDKPVYIANVRVDRGRYSFIDGSYETLLNAYNSGATVGLNASGYMYYLHHIDGDNNLYFGQIPYSSIGSNRSTPNYNLMIAPDNSFTQFRMDIATQEFVWDELKNIPEPVQADLMQEDPTQPDYVKGKEEFLAQASSGQNATWDTLEGKPTYVQTGPRTVVWDGAMDGERFVATSYDSKATYLKISNEIPSKAELAGAKLTHSSEMFAPGPITDIDDGTSCYDSGYCGILVVTQAGEIKDSYSRKGVAPGTGIYVRLEGYEGQDSPSLRLSYGEYSQEKFDPAWLPDGGFGWEGPGGKTDILPESALVMDENTQTMPMPDGRTLYGYMFHPLPITENLTEGQEYQVAIDGVTHRKTCVVPDVVGIPYRLLGNLALLQIGEDTGEDWVFFAQSTEHPTISGADYWVGMFATTNTEYKTVAVSAQGTVVHQIEDRFIPASVARKDEITWATIPDKPFGVTVTSLAAPMTLAEMRYTGSYSYGMGFLPKRITAGERYLVSMDGEITEWVAQQSDNDVYLGVDPKTFTGGGAISDGAYSIHQPSIGSLLVYLAGERTQPIIGVAHVEIKYIDERVIPDSIARVGQIPEQVQGNWSQNDPTQPDYIRDRTHYVEGEETVIRMDGITEGMAAAYLDGVPVLYKVSDAVPSWEDLTGAVIASIDNPDAEKLVITEEMLAGGKDDSTDAVRIVTDPFPLYIALYDNAILADIKFPQSGTYAMAEMLAEGVRLAITCGSATYHPLDEKFIPDTIARKTDISTGVVIFDYDVSTWEEVNAAYNSGAIMFCRKDNYILPFVENTNGFLIFKVVREYNLIVNARINSDGWKTTQDVYVSSASLKTQVNNVLKEHGLIT